MRAGARASLVPRERARAKWAYSSLPARAALALPVVEQAGYAIGVTPRRQLSTPSSSTRRVLRRLAFVPRLPSLSGLVAVSLLMGSACTKTSDGSTRVVTAQSVHGGANPTTAVAPAGAKAPAAAPTPTPEPEPQVVWDEDIAHAAAKLTEAANASQRAWDRLAYMTDMFGPRLSGSKALEAAIDWSVETMTADGLANARREKVMVPHWVRGEERAKIVAPVERELEILGLGGTVGTGRRGVKGEIVVFDSLDAMKAAGEKDKSAIEGKIVVLNQAMPDYDASRPDSAGYGKTVKIRGDGPSEAARFGAKAVLIRSVTARSLRTPHTGMTRYADDVKKIPAAALTVEDAEFLSRMAARGKAEVQLFLGAKTLPDAESANAVAEIVGSEKPEEVIVIGGHIDSWDTGTGANDDASGCLMAMEAAKLLLDLGLQPKRTIRVVLFTNEENGLRGGEAYYEAHKDETHVAAIEADSGSGAPFGFGVAGDDAQVAALAAYAPLFKGLGSSNIAKGWGGADISPLMKHGTLGISVRPDGSWYFDVHHSPADTVDKIDPKDLQRNAASMALLAYILAQRE